MPTVTFLIPANHVPGAEAREVRVPCSPGTTALDVATRHGVLLETMCGGVAVCGRCKVAPEAVAHADGPSADEPSADGLSAVDTQERVRLDAMGVTDGTRLACQARITGDAVLRVPERRRP